LNPTNAESPKSPRCWPSTVSLPSKKLTDERGVDVCTIVKGIQPICFENVCWAYILGAAIALKKGQKSYQPYWALAGNLLNRMQRWEEAKVAYGRALGLCDDQSMCEFLLRKIAEADLPNRRCTTE
jgi:hypothetical protein